MKKEPKASIVVLNWNGKQYLEKCIPSLQELDYPDYEIILVDNGSTDDSVNFVELAFPEVRIIENKINLGFAGGMNAGLKEAKGEIIALLNNDIIVKKEWLKELVKAMVADERVGIAGCKILYPDERTLQHAGGIITRPLALADHYGYREIDRGQYDEVNEVDYVTGAALAIKREILARIGYFDEGFFPIYYEETDLCFRARKVGYKVIYVPKAVVIHLESATTVQGSYNYFLFFHRNRLRFVLKHFSAKEILEDFFPAEMRRFASLSLRKERLALIKAYKETLSRLPSILAVRMERISEGEAKKVEKNLQSLIELAEAAMEEQRIFPSPKLDELISLLNEKWEVKERPFVSHIPLLGPLIVRVREAWNWMAAKWYVRQILQQQVEFNLLLVQSFKEMVNCLGQVEYSTIQNDRTNVALIRRVALLEHHLGLLEEELKRLISAPK